MSDHFIPPQRQEVEQPAFEAPERVSKAGHDDSSSIFLSSSEETNLEESKAFLEGGGTSRTAGLDPRVSIDATAQGPAEAGSQQHDTSLQGSGTAPRAGDWPDASSGEGATTRHSAGPLLWRLFPRCIRATNEEVCIAAEVTLNVSPSECRVTALKGGQALPVRVDFLNDRQASREDDDQPSRQGRGPGGFRTTTTSGAAAARRQAANEMLRPLRSSRPDSEYVLIWLTPGTTPGLMLIELHALRQESVGPATAAGVAAGGGGSGGSRQSADASTLHAHSAASTGALPSTWRTPGPSGGILGARVADLAGGGSTNAGGIPARFSGSAYLRGTGGAADSYVTAAGHSRAHGQSTSLNDVRLYHLSGPDRLGGDDLLFRGALSSGPLSVIIVPDAGMEEEVCALLELQHQQTPLPLTTGAPPDAAPPGAAGEGLAAMAAAAAAATVGLPTSPGGGGVTAPEDRLRGLAAAAAADALAAEGEEDREDARARERLLWDLGAWLETSVTAAAVRESRALAAAARETDQSLERPQHHHVLLHPQPPVRTALLGVRRLQEPRQQRALQQPEHPPRVLHGALGGNMAADIDLAESMGEPLSPRGMAARATLSAAAAVPVPAAAVSGAAFISSSASAVARGMVLPTASDAATALVSTHGQTASAVPVPRSTLELLGFACSRGWPATTTHIVLGLMDMGHSMPRINAAVQDAHGWSALHLAVASGSAELVAMTSLWRSYWRYADASTAQEEWRAMLAAAGPGGLTPLHLAAVLPQPATAALDLISSMPAETLTTWFGAAARDGCTSAHYASRAGNAHLNDHALLCLATGIGALDLISEQGLQEVLPYVGDLQLDQLSPTGTESGELDISPGPEGQPTGTSSGSGPGGGRVSGSNGAGSASQGPGGLPSSASRTSTFGISLAASAEGGVGQRIASRTVLSPSQPTNAVDAVDAAARDAAAAAVAAAGGAALPASTAPSIGATGSREVDAAAVGSRDQAPRRRGAASVRTATPDTPGAEGADAALQGTQAPASAVGTGAAAPGPPSLQSQVIETGAPVASAASSRSGGSAATAARGGEEPAGLAGRPTGTPIAVSSVLERPCGLLTAVSAPAPGPSRSVRMQSPDTTERRAPGSSISQRGLEAQENRTTGSSASSGSRGARPPAASRSSLRFSWLPRLVRGRLQCFGGRGMTAGEDDDEWRGGSQATTGSVSSSAGRSSEPRAGGPGQRPSEAASAAGPRVDGLRPAGLGLVGSAEVGAGPRAVGPGRQSSAERPAAAGSGAARQGSVSDQSAGSGPAGAPEPGAGDARAVATQPSIATAGPAAAAIAGAIAAEATALPAALQSPPDPGQAADRPGWVWSAAAAAAASSVVKGSSHGSATEPPEQPQQHVQRTQQQQQQQQELHQQRQQQQGPGQAAGSHPPPPRPAPSHNDPPPRTLLCRHNDAAAPSLDEPPPRTLLRHHDGAAASPLGRAPLGSPPLFESQQQRHPNVRASEAWATGPASEPWLPPRRGWLDASQVVVGLLDRVSSGPSPQSTSHEHCFSSAASGNQRTSPSAPPQGLTTCAGAAPHAHATASSVSVSDAASGPSSHTQAQPQAQSQSQSQSQFQFQFQTPMSLEQARQAALRYVFAAARAVCSGSEQGEAEADPAGPPPVAGDAAKASSAPAGTGIKEGAAAIVGVVAGGRGVRSEPVRGAMRLLAEVVMPLEEITAQLRNQSQQQRLMLQMRVTQQLQRIRPDLQYRPLEQPAAPPEPASGSALPLPAQQHHGQQREQRVEEQGGPLDVCRESPPQAPEPPAASLNQDHQLQPQPQPHSGPPGDGGQLAPAPLHLGCLQPALGPSAPLQRAEAPLGVRSEAAGLGAAGQATPISEPGAKQAGGPHSNETSGSASQGADAELRNALASDFEPGPSAREPAGSGLHEAAAAARPSLEVESLEREEVDGSRPAFTQAQLVPSPHQGEAELRQRPALMQPSLSVPEGPMDGGEAPPPAAVLDVARVGTQANQLGHGISGVGMGEAEAAQHDASDVLEGGPGPVLVQGGGRLVASQHLPQRQRPPSGSRRRQQRRGGLSRAACAAVIIGRLAACPLLTGALSPPWGLADGSAVSSLLCAAACVVWWAVVGVLWPLTSARPPASTGGIPPGRTAHLALQLLGLLVHAALLTFTQWAAAAAQAPRVCGQPAGVTVAAADYAAASVTGAATTAAAAALDMATAFLFGLLLRGAASGFDIAHGVASGSGSFE